MNEMKTILTVNGTQYSVQAPPGYVLTQGDIEQAKQNILSGKIHALNPATCTDVVQGTTHDVTLTATGGQPNYTYRLLLDGGQIATAGPIAATSQVFSVLFNQAVGPHTLRGEITDQCATPQTSGDQCTTFNITAPTGSISCTTTPSGASVALDGVSQGVVTPVTLTNVSAGSHTVTFTLAAYNACPVTVTVTAGSTSTASCTMTVTCPAITSCSITACPPASIIQGTATSLTASWVGGTPNYSVQLLRDGVDYGSPSAVSGTSVIINFNVDTSWTVDSHTVSATITDGCSTPQTCTTSTCTVAVTAPTGSIFCTTTPSGASVALDGVSQGVVTPVTLTNVSAVSHTVTFTLAGYNACPVTVTVVAGESNSPTNTFSTTPIKLKTITLTNGLNGQQRFSFELKSGTNGLIGYAQIYRNGVARGTIQNASTQTFELKTEDLTQDWAAGDTAELWAWAAGPNSATVQNFRIASTASCTMTVTCSVLGINMNIV